MVDVSKVAEANVGHDVISLTTVPIPPKGKKLSTLSICSNLERMLKVVVFEAMATVCSVF